MATRLRRPWIQVVVETKQRWSSERWRLHVLGAVEGWRDVVVAWNGCSFLREFGKSHEAPDELEAQEDLIEWAWDVVSPAVSESVRQCAARSSLSDATFALVFDVLRGHGLIYPDGSVHDAVLARINTEVAVVDMRKALAVTRMSDEIEESKAKKSQRKKP